MSFFNLPRPVMVDEPGRPTHFNEDQNVRVPDDQGAVDFSTETEPTPQEFGFQPQPEAIPVFLTEPPPNVRPIRKWQGDTVTVVGSSPPMEILTEDRHRVRAVITNLDDADPVYLTVTGGNNNPGLMARKLGPGKEIEFFHNQPVWLFTTGVLSAEVSWHWEWEMDPE